MVFVEQSISLIFHIEVRIFIHLGLDDPSRDNLTVFKCYRCIPKIYVKHEINPNSIKSHSFTIRYTLETFPEEDIAKFLILLVDAGSFSGATKGI